MREGGRAEKVRNRRAARTRPVDEGVNTLCEIALPAEAAMLADPGSCAALPRSSPETAGAARDLLFPDLEAVLDSKRSSSHRGWVGRRDSRCHCTESILRTPYGHASHENMSASASRVYLVKNPDLSEGGRIDAGIAWHAWSSLRVYRSN